MKILLAAAALVVVTLSGASAAAYEPSGIARFREDETFRHFNYEPGTVSVWRTSLLLERQNQTVGFAIYACVRAVERLECTATYVLPRGKIQAAGDVLTRGHLQLLLLDGTGAYDNANGVVQVTRPFVTFYFN